MALKLLRESFGGVLGQSELGWFWGLSVWVCGSTRIAATLNRPLRCRSRAWEEISFPHNGAKNLAVAALLPWDTNEVRWVVRCLEVGFASHLLVPYQPAFDPFSWWDPFYRGTPLPGISVASKPLWPTCISPVSSLSFMERDGGGGACRVNQGGVYGLRVLERGSPRDRTRNSEERPNISGCPK